jgi:hypothetical protein
MEFRGKEFKFSNEAELCAGGNRSEKNEEGKGRRIKNKKAEWVRLTMDDCDRLLVAVTHRDVEVRAYKLCVACWLVAA